MPRTTSHDALVVGSGATGGWVAKELTRHGLRVLLLEAGPRLRFAPPRRQEAGWASRKPVQSTCFACTDQTHRFFVDDEEQPYDFPRGAPFIWIRGRQLGGRTLVWSRQCYRFSDEQFHAASLDGHGEDWPVSYRELSPYYERVERFLGVTGRRDGLWQVPDGAFRPPVRLGRVALALQASLGKRGRKVIVARLASEGRPGARCPSCGRTGACGEFPFFSSPGSTLHAALATGRLTVRPNAVVSHLEVDGHSGLASGCAFVDRVTGRSHQARARVVVLCASTIESTRVLLNSGGLEDASGQLGRNLTDHTYGVRLMGTLPFRRGDGAPGLSLLYVPWPHRGARGARRSFLRGYGVQVAVFHPAPAERRPAIVHLVSFGEMLSRPENRITLMRERDAHGIPLPRIRCLHSENELRMARHQAEALEEMARDAGIEVQQVSEELRPPGSAIHEACTARMGRDPRRSVLDPHNRMWGVKNLYVVDGSSYPSIGFQNPALTMMALAARAADHVAAGMKRREL